MEGGGGIGFFFMRLAQKYAFISKICVFLIYACKKRISVNAYFLEYTHTINARNLYGFKKSGKKTHKISEN